MYFYQKDKPSEVKNDHRGVPIEIGKRVAFNRSGDVEFGTIVSFSAKWRVRKEKYQNPDGKLNWILNFALVIKRESGGESTVKNYKSFIIVE